MKRALITGGAGFIGFHLARLLHSQGCEVTVFDNLSRGKMDSELKNFLEKKNTVFIKGDLTDSGATGKLESYDEVYHLAAVQGTGTFYKKPKHVLRTNVLSTINVLDWFVSSKSRKILFSSSSETYAGTISRFHGSVPTPEDIPLCIEDVFNPRWSYGGSKILGELLFANYALEYGFDYAILRYHNVYGTRMGTEHVIPQFILRALRNEEPFYVYGGSETRAFCHVSDAVKATKLVMDSKAKGIVNIGNDNEEIKIAELARRLLSFMGLDTRIEMKPAPKGSVARRCPDITKLRSLGFAPTVKLGEGLEDTIEWHRKNHLKEKIMG